MNTARTQLGIVIGVVVVAGGALVYAATSHLPQAGAGIQTIRAAQSVPPATPESTPTSANTPAPNVATPSSAGPDDDHGGSGSGHDDDAKLDD